MKYCKNCDANQLTKSGKVRGKQRYRCKACNCNFVMGDQRTHRVSPAKKALATLLYSSGKCSYRFIAKLLSVNVSSVQRWLEKEADKLSENMVSSEIKAIEFDEMWHFIRKKKAKDGLSKPWIVVRSEQLPGLSAGVILLPFNGCMKR